MNLKECYQYVMQQREDCETITVNLLLTELCNFECSHCFYKCSARNSPVYMTNEFLDRVYHQQILPLQELGFRVSVNLIGGEPTVNLNEFERCIRKVDSWGEDVEIQMTTNGWWIHRTPTLIRFLNIVLPILQGYDRGELGFSIRISNDPYHDEFRPDHLKGKRLNYYLSDLFNGYHEDLYTFTYYCNDCGEDFDSWVDECPKCESEDIIEDDYPEYALNTHLPDPADTSEFYNWIYAEDSKHSGGVIPTGRAQYWGDNDKGAGGYCFTGSYLTFIPSGMLTDVCCSGSDFRAGTVDTHPVILLTLAKYYIEQVKPTCRECHDLAEDWLDSNLVNILEKLTGLHQEESELLEQEF